MRVLRYFITIHSLIMIINKQSVGIDVGKNELFVRILQQEKDKFGFRKHRGVKKFDNKPAGFLKLHEWLQKYTTTDAPLSIVMEATGVYHEELAYFLYGESYLVTIELPTKVKAFAKSHNLHTKTDVVDAEIIARLGIERNLSVWTPPSKSMRQLKALTRQLQAITEAKTATRNQLHASNHSAFPMKAVLDRYQQIIDLQEEQSAMIEKEIRRLAKEDKDLDRILKLLMTIRGIALRTAAAITAETGGFQLFESRNQLVKYAGMDIKEKLSGSSVRGRSSMSKAGNSRIRRALHMPSLQYTNDDGVFGQVYTRVFERTGIKMKGLVAVQRKLLTIMYAIVKSGLPYDAKLHKARHQKGVGEPELAYSDSVS